MVYAHTLLFYHLHLSHILSASHFNEAQDLRGSEAAQDLESMEDATDGVLRALKSKSKRCSRDSQCEDDEECSDRECVTKSSRDSTSSSEGKRKSIHDVSHNSFECSQSN